MLPQTQIYTDSRGAPAHTTAGIGKAGTKHIDYATANAVVCINGKL